MGKRKHPSHRQHTQGTSGIEIIAEDILAHPLCPHGPTLLFSCERGDFYACASCRGRECRVHIAREDWSDPRVREKNTKFQKLAPRFDKEEAWKKYQTVKSKPPGDRAYCIKCDSLHSPSQLTAHAGHSTVTPLTDQELAHPSAWLPSLQNDSVEAQYIFSGESINTILSVVRNNEIRNVLCIGTPSIHEAAQRHGDLNSLLLDYDSRHHQFWSPHKFLWYNMFNHHFFNGPDDEKIFEQFLESSRETGMCVVMDPPFGGRVEPLAHTLRSIRRRYNDVLGRPQDHLLPVIWAFPYFSEPYIINMLPEFKMHDYQVEYTNHTKFKRASKAKSGSPVRLFTSLPLATVDLSLDPNYRHCARCDKWVSRANRHCERCDACTGKSGVAYVHCDACARCVKPTFLHCDACGRCCQRRGHVCGVDIPIRSCYNCKEKGHKRIDCPQLKPNKIQEEKNMKRSKRKKS